jgi:hypothetical protein
VLLDVGQGEDLVQARDHRQLLGLERLHSGPPEQLADEGLDLDPGVLHPVLGVELLAVEVVGHLDRQGAEVGIEGVAQRVRRVGRQDHRPEALVGAGQRRRRRGGGLADPSLAGEQQDPGRHERPNLTSPGSRAARGGPCG